MSARRAERDAKVIGTVRAALAHDLFDDQFAEANRHADDMNAEALTVGQSVANAISLAFGAKLRQRQRGESGHVD